MRFACLLPVAPVCIPQTDGNVYKYMPRALYTEFPALTHFWSKKKPAMTYEVTPIYLFRSNPIEKKKVLLFINFACFISKFRCQIFIKQLQREFKKKEQFIVFFILQDTQEQMYRHFLHNQLVHHIFVTLVHKLTDAICKKYFSLHAELCMHNILDLFTVCKSASM
jgi:hypothetical protein